MTPKSLSRLRCEPLEGRETPAVLYVAPTGSDTAAGTSTAPLQTLQAAANRVVAGDTVVVRAGTYRGFNLFTSGTAAARITFQADPGVTVNQPNAWNNRDGINLEGASYVTIDGFAVTGQPRAGIRSVTNQFVTIRNNVTDANTVWGIFTGFSSDLLVENNQASRSAQQHGIYVSNSADRPVVRGNTVFENFASGIQLNADVTVGGDGIISNAVIENNLLRANGAGGGASINLDGVQDSDVRNNRIDNARATGIALFQQNGATGSRNNRVVNNTVIVDNSLAVSNGRWAVTISNGSTGNVVRNNILFSTHSFRGALSVSADSLSGLSSDYNATENRFSADDGNTAVTLAAWRTNTGQDIHSVPLADATALNALFVDRAGGDLHLSPLSAAVNAGTTLGAPAFDFEGDGRPLTGGVDIGADERMVALPVNTPPTISPLPNIGLYRNTSSPPLAFRVGDAQTPAASLVVTVTSSDPLLLPATGLRLGGSGADRTLTVTPAANRTGRATITLTVRDANGATAVTSFTVNVIKPPTRNR